MSGQPPTKVVLPIGRLRSPIAAAALFTVRPPRVAGLDLEVASVSGDPMRTLWRNALARRREPAAWRVKQTPVAQLALPVVSRPGTRRRALHQLGGV
jgi:hypothetical protein